MTGLQISSTGKSLSEALIFASTNPRYDDRLFIELQVIYLAHVIEKPNLRIPNPQYLQLFF